MATFQLFFQSGRAKDLSAPLYILISFKQCSQGSSVSTVTGLWFWWMKARISIPVWGQRFSNSKRPDRLWGPPRLLLTQ